ncbi:repressor LexA [Candidatus Kryptonium thompsonii]|uniref:Repressor LexA n=2 Tax=Candidatus Kryptonium thompsonii TaxID=1633631 RepID=A0A0P1L7C0_9BACT|nr:transcriptional repressor LexA [Candidatus Kryptonium thompsoni]CUS76708.1 repressor LexA [Candidatus Kryptonium thompsoni]CUS78225.1 repressor LexA [Candidatus Kryptonium thompsoni]CUS79177.1 repressor LexA [Candidatus Kryptonium thompsoni]CUS83553.1 repressor LexA [Candidatus Kryptonium thompsoni]CUS86899.1 repressor LexA [Candidatus Kryptonium thompsoni]
MKEALTKRQNQIFEFIKKYTIENHKPPTIREICKKFNFKSTNSAYSVLKALERKGYIQRTNLKARNININDFKLDKTQIDLKEIPLISTFDAQNPLRMFTNLNGTIKLDMKIFDTLPSFAVEVTDDGMQKDGIFKGDIAIITQSLEIKNGSIVFAVIKNEGLIRHYKNENNEIYLIPSSRGYETLKFKEGDKNLWIGGEVSFIIRKLKR